MDIRKKATEAAPETGNKNNKKIIFVQPFELFFYPVVNLPHGKST